MSVEYPLTKITLKDDIPNLTINADIEYIETEKNIQTDTIPYNYKKVYLDYEGHKLEYNCETKLIKVVKFEDIHYFNMRRDRCLDIYGNEERGCDGCQSISVFCGNDAIVRFEKHCNPLVHTIIDIDIP